MKKTITAQEKLNLDAPITKEELEKVVRKLQHNKSPGPDGIPAEFYQVFWHTLKDFYFDFITTVEKNLFPIEQTHQQPHLSTKAKVKYTSWQIIDQLH